MFDVVGRQDEIRFDRTEQNLNDVRFAQNAIEYAQDHYELACVSCLLIDGFVFLEKDNFKIYSFEKNMRGINQ